MKPLNEILTKGKRRIRLKITFKFFGKREGLLVMMGYGDCLKMGLDEFRRV